MSIRLVSIASIAVSLSLIGGAPAKAQDGDPGEDTRRHAIGMRAGNLGIGIDYGYRISDRLAIRIGINGSGTSFDDTEAGIDYEFDLDFDSEAVGLDVHPFKGAFRLSFGMLLNDSSLAAVGAATTGTVTIGDTVYPAALVGTLRGNVPFDGTVPFAAFGWDWRQNKRIGIALDFGLVDQDSPRVELTADGVLASFPPFQADLQQEQAELQESLDDLDLYPYATFGLVFRF